MSLPGRWRWCDRPWLCDARKEQNALHTLIHHRRLTPSCGGLAPTAERTMDPARIFTESLTPRPELENNQGQKRTSPVRLAMSALSPKADKEQTCWYVRFVPKADLRTAAKHRYSITSSASKRNDSGIESPSALAVLRLTRTAKFVGCTTGRSAGLSPRKMRPI